MHLVNTFDEVFFMGRKRILFVAIICLTLFSVLLGRLVQIQLVSTEHFSLRGINLLESSVKQRTQEVEIDNGRGTFLDRNGELLLHDKKRVLILFPFLKNMDWSYGEIANITGIPKTELLSSINKADEPFIYGDKEPLLLTKQQMDRINSLEIPGVFAVEKKYLKEEFLAEQLIGIAGENEQLLRKRYPDYKLSPQTAIGLSGLEKSFDEFLLSDGSSKLVYHVDGRGGPLFGLQVKYVSPSNPYYPVNIKTTLDKHLQQLAEDIADKHKVKKGGVLILDIETNSVLASVSRPNINKENPFAKSGGLQNVMVKQQIPGSIFKTVVAAAAIEEGLDGDERKFDCSRTIHGEADPNYQHGMLNFTESFARSCNNTFGTLAKELMAEDENILEHYAEKLSLLDKVSWNGDIYHLQNFTQLEDEEKGRVFLKEEDKKDENFVAMTGIGQHEVRVTPLAVANMMATIARGGRGESVRFVSEISYKNGTSFIPFPEKKLENVSISPYTAEKLQRLLREVVKDEQGTGHSLSQLPYEVAGKSGTAETGKFKGKKQLYNKWFAGYFPYNHPKYVVVAVHLDVTENSGSVQKLFADIVKGIYDWENKYNQ